MQCVVLMSCLSAGIGASEPPVERDRHENALLELGEQPVARGRPQRQAERIDRGDLRFLVIAVQLRADRWHRRIAERTQRPDAGLAHFGRRVVEKTLGDIAKLLRGRQPGQQRQRLLPYRRLPVSRGMLRPFDQAWIAGSAVPRRRQGRRGFRRAAAVPLIPT